MRRLAQGSRHRIAALVLLAGLASAPLPGVGDRAWAQSATQRSAAAYAPHVADASRRFGIPEAWIWAVMHVESRGRTRAVSHAGAMGLMQIMPGTWTILRLRYGLGRDPFDVRDNIMAGAAYLREMYNRYRDPIAMVAAYNAGPGRYDEYRARGRPLPAETVAYVAQLRPMLGGGAPVQYAVADVPDPHAWRRADLFAIRPSSAETVESLAVDDEASVASGGPQPSNISASGGLFVALSGHEPR